MMVKNFRKVISIICVVALLLSLSVVSMVNPSSAAIADDDMITPTYETVLDLNFNNEKGVTAKNANSFSVTYVDSGTAAGDKALKLETYSGDSCQIGADNNQGFGGTPFMLEAATTYRITYKFKVLKGSQTQTASASVNKKGVTFYTANVAYTTRKATSGLDRYITFDSTNSKKVVSNGTERWELLNDTDWIDATVSYTTASTIAAGYETLAFATVHCNRRSIVLIDDFKIEKMTGYTLDDIDEEYSYDFYDTANDKVWDATATIKGLSKTTDNHKHYLLCNVLGNKNNKASMTDADGLHFYPYSKGDLNKTTYGWNGNNAILYDPDEGGTFKIKDETAYLITVKYKVLDINLSTWVRLGVGAIKADGSTAVNNDDMYMAVAIGYAENTEVSDDWEYLTVKVDTGDADAKKYADGYFTLMGCSQKDSASYPVEFLVDEVSIREVRNETKGVSYINFVNGSGLQDTGKLAVTGTVIDLPRPTYADANTMFLGWYTSPDYKANEEVALNNYTIPAGDTTLYAKFGNAVTSKVTFIENGVKTVVNLPIGQTLRKGDRPHNRVFFDGWYTDTSFTEEVTKVPGVDITLYAKYTGAYVEFDNTGAVESYNGGCKHIADPDDANNKVVKFTAGNSRPNFMFPLYDMAGSPGYAMEVNTKYYYSFKVKVAAGAGSGSIILLQGDRSNYADSTTTRSLIGSTEYKYAANNSTENSEWITVSGNFTTGETFYLENIKWSYQNHIFFSLMADSVPSPNGGVMEGVTTVYVDDFLIYKALEENPEGTSGIFFKTNGSDVSPIFGFPGEKVELTEEPRLAGNEFVGWYTDKNVSVPYTGKTFGTENITLYAKWKSANFVCDFEEYNTAGMLSRAKIVKKGDNHVLDYNPVYSATQSDNSTLYRAFINDGYTKYTVTEGAEYTVTFKYKLTRGTLKYGIITSAPHNTWVNHQQQIAGTPIAELTDEWQEASLTFTVANESKYKSDWNSLTLGLGGDAEAEIDDVKVTCSLSFANIYGSSIIFLNANGGKSIDPISGDPGETIGKIPTPKRAGYKFKGWYTDAELTTLFTGKTYGEDDITLYAGWILGKFNEGYEDYPSTMLSIGVSSGYSLYNSSTAGYDKANVQQGTTSVFRNGTVTGVQNITICRDEALALESGKQYTLSFYVKPTNVGNAAGTINLIGMAGNANISYPESTTLITSVGELKTGEWQLVNYTFTADSKYIGLSTTDGNDMYFDNFTVALKGYTGSANGDSSVSPIIITLMIAMAAAALVLTGKKVFDK